MREVMYAYKNVILNIHKQENILWEKENIKCGRDENDPTLKK